MGDAVPPEGDPFSGIPFIGELMRMIQGQSGGSTDVARQLARTIANDGQTEPNVDPIDRIAVQELVRVAELQIAATTDLPVSRGGPLTVEVGNRSQWADRTIDDYRPLFETLSGSMAGGLVAPDDLPADDPMAAIMASLGQMMGPMMLGMTTGSMVGHLARRALGGHHLPVPRPPDEPILVLLRNVDEFGREWSLDRDDLRLWVCLNETAHHTVSGCFPRPGAPHRPPATATPRRSSRIRRPSRSDSADSISVPAPKDWPSSRPNSAIPTRYSVRCAHLRRRHSNPSSPRSWPRSPATSTM